MIKTCDKLPLFGSACTRWVERRLSDQFGLLKGIALAQVPQELQESDIPWQVAFTDTTQYSQVGLAQRKQALGSMLVHVTARLCLLRVIDVCMDIARERPVVAR
jgi:hypothetical protein